MMALFSRTWQAYCRAMRALKPIVGAGLAVLVAMVGAPVSAVDNVTLPFTVSPGSFVEVNVTSCPVPETATAVARLAPEGGAVQVEVTGDASGGAAELQALLPTDAAVGTWTAEASCLDANGDVVDGPATAEFTVATFALLTIDPAHRSRRQHHHGLGGGLPDRHD